MNEVPVALRGVDGRLRLAVAGDGASTRLADTDLIIEVEQDRTIYVIDVSAGDKIPRKGGPGITRSDLLVINKVDLATHMGADLGVMDRDARRMRGERPFVFTNLKIGDGVERIVRAIVASGGLVAKPVALTPV